MENIINFLKKNWYYIAAVVLVIVVIVIIRRRRSNGDDDNSDTGHLTGAEDINATFPLQPYSLVKTYSSAKGSKGNQIKKLQSIYNNNNSGGTPLDVNGKYGPKSEAVFKGFFTETTEINPNGTITEAQYNAILEKFA